MLSYASIGEIKASDRLNITDTTSDNILTDVIEAVSRWIDDQTGRRFDSVTETRYFTSENSRILNCDDIATATGLFLYTDDGGDGTFEITWSSTDYNLRPYNRRDGWPYEAIEVTYNGLYAFPRVRRGVKITATFGWPSVPPQIKQACLLQSERMFKRFATPLGSSGMSALGEVRLSIPAADGDVMALLAPFMRLME